MVTKLADMTTYEVAQIVARARCVVLVPIGSTEPHGPHLPLGTDVLISEAVTERAAALLVQQGVDVLIAPSVAYGVTDYARGFVGAVGISAHVMTALLIDITQRLLDDGFKHVCFVNNHLEPAHDEAVRAAAGHFAHGIVSVACPLSRRWARTLSDEFKQGKCHAGRYETSLVQAAKGRVLPEATKLPPLDLSLSDAISAGKTTFLEIGMSEAYTGSPALASEEEGQELLERLAAMTVTEVLEGLAAREARS